MPIDIAIILRGAALARVILETSKALKTLPKGMPRNLREVNSLLKFLKKLTSSDNSLYTTSRAIRWGRPSETVVEGETGYLVNPKDLNWINESMRVLLESHPLRHDMGANIRQRILKNFTLEKSTTNLLMEIEK